MKVVDNTAEGIVSQRIIQRQNIHILNVGVNKCMRANHNAQLWKLDHSSTEEQTGHPQRLVRQGR